MRSLILFSIIFTLIASPALAITATAEKDARETSSAPVASTRKQPDTKKTTTTSTQPVPKTATPKKSVAVQKTIPKTVPKSVEQRKPIGAIGGFFSGIGFAVSNSLTFDTAKKAEKESNRAKTLTDSAEARIQTGDEKEKVKAEREIKKATALVSSAKRHIDDAKAEGNERADAATETVVATNARVQEVTDLASKRITKKAVSVQEKKTDVKPKTEIAIPEPTIEELENVQGELKKVIDDTRYPPEFTSFLQNVHKNVETRVSERKSIIKANPR